MKIFQRKPSERSMSDKAAKAIASSILKVQDGFANILQRITSNWRQKHQWIFLYLVCGLFGTLSILAIMQSFKTCNTSRIIILKSILVPKSIYRENETFLITEREFQQVEEYKAAHPGLLKIRPGLYDSLSLIEQSYYSQQK